MMTHVARVGQFVFEDDAADAGADEVDDGAVAGAHVLVELAHVRREGPELAGVVAEDLLVDQVLEASVDDGFGAWGEAFDPVLDGCAARILRRFP